MVAKLIETREIIIRCTVIFMGIITIQPPRWSLPFLCILWTHWDQEIPLLWKVTLEKKYISWVLLLGNVMLLCIYHNKLANSLSQLYNNKKRKKNTRKELMPEEFYKMTVSNLQKCEFRYFNVCMWWQQQYWTKSTFLLHQI